jgi:glycosyltransferase involved in cell wall biosynthesis
VAVVIPTYDYGRFVARAVQSALDQTLPPVEVVVVDDGSTDDTPDVLRAFGSRIRVVRQANRGVAAARNRGARESSAGVLAFLDADDAWHPRMLAVTVAALRHRPDAGAVHCGLREVDEQGGEVGLTVSGWGGRIAEDLLMMRPVLPLTGSASLVPRTVFEALGGYDERLSTSADWDLCLRISLEHPIVFVPDALVSYTLHRSNMHGDLTAMEHDMRLGFEKAFTAHPELDHLRNPALARLYMTLSGSYLSSGERRRALEYAIRSVRLSPVGLRHALGLPVRRLRRRLRPA